MTVNEALKSLVASMKQIYGDALKEIILYGSTARGTDTQESDLDIALIIYPGTCRDQFNRMIESVAELEIMCDKVLSVIPIDYSKFAEWEDILPYYRNIRKEGLILWQAA